MLSARHSAKLQVFYPQCASFASFYAINTKWRIIGKKPVSCYWRPCSHSITPFLWYSDPVFIFKPWRLSFSRSAIMPLFLYGFIIRGNELLILLGS